MKKILATIMALVMCMSMLMPMTAAGAEGAGNAPEWLVPYAETVTLTTVNSAAANAQWTQDGDSISNNVWTRAFKDALNIDLVMTWASDDYDTKLNLDISTGNLPDVFKVNEVQLSQLIEAGALMDLTEVFEKYASPKVKELMAIDPSVVTTAIKDGKMYAIPKTAEIRDANMLYLREDWLKQLGKTAPTTVAELEELLVQFMEISGGYGFPTDSGLGTLYNIANAWGAYPNIWHKNEEGKIINGKTSAQMKEALAAWAEWYKKGILKADFATMNGDVIKEDLVNGKVGAYSGQSWAGWYCGTDMVNNLGLDCYMMPYEVPTVSGEKALYELNLPQEGYIVISKDCKNPEAAMQLVNYFCYVVYEALPLGMMTPAEVEAFTAGNRIHAITAPKVGNLNISLERRAQIAEALETGDTSVLVDATSVECYNGTLKWVNDKDTAFFPYWNQFGAEGGGLDRLNDITVADLFIRNALWGESPQEWLDYSSTLNDIMLEGFTKIIMGEEPIEYFDVLVEQWYIAGGQECEDVINEMYNK